VDYFMNMEGFDEIIPSNIPDIDKMVESEIRDEFGNGPFEKIGFDVHSCMECGT
jgi:hypothetical protein